MTTMIWTARYADAPTLAHLRANPDSIGQFLVGTDVDEALLDAPPTCTTWRSRSTSTISGRQSISC